MATNNELWSGMRIPIVMVSGPVNSGKTLFGLTIDPNCRRPAAEVQPTTLIYDQEGSAEPYVGGLNFDWKDTRAAVAAGVHNQVVAAGPSDPRWLATLKTTADCNDSPPASMFRAWYLSLLSLPAGKYAVGICDTFTPLQDGMVDWLRRHPEVFGRTVNEYTKASSMFLWPDVKSMLSHILTVDCRLRFQTFAINVHLKNEWAGGAKTGQKVAEGLDVLEKLATLHLELDRAPTAKGKDAPRLPAAIVKKERLVRFGATGGEDLPILPPRLPACTPDAIRKYIASPPDFAKLEPGERLPDTSMGEDERLRIQAAIAENNRVAGEAQLSALEMARKAAEAGRYQVAVQYEAAAAATQTPAQSPTAVAAQTPAGPAPITDFQAKEVMGLLRELFTTGAEAQAWLTSHGHPNPATLTKDDANGLLADLSKMKYQRQQAAITTPAPAPTNGNGQHATPEQRATIRELTMAIHGEQAPTQQAAWLQSLGYSSPMSLTYAQAQQRILELEAIAQPVAAAAAPDEIPF